MTIKIIKNEFMLAKEVRNIIASSTPQNKTCGFFIKVSEAKLVAAIDRYVNAEVLPDMMELLETMFDKIASYWDRLPIIYAIFKKMLNCFALESISEVYNDLSYAAVRGGGVVRPTPNEVFLKLIERAKNEKVEFSLEMQKM